MLEFLRGDLVGKGSLEESLANESQDGGLQEVWLGRLGSENARLGDGFVVIGRGLGGAGAAQEAFESGHADVETETVGARLGQAFPDLMVGAAIKPIEELFLFGGSEGVFDDEVFTHRMVVWLGLILILWGLFKFDEKCE